ncbi:MAG: ribonuclease HII [Balneolaceae bacterium]
MSEPGNRLEYEERLWSEGFQRVLGLDEVGRGCLSGPVVAAGVILKPGSTMEGIRDSKQLSGKDRDELAILIREKALFWAIQSCSPAEIDRLNILNASIEAMMKCASQRGASPDYLLVDGNRFAPCLTPVQCIVKGDDRSQSIAAASILAKVYRDGLMRDLHMELPVYGWNTNVGYPTRAHYKGLRTYGYSKYHRKSFNLKTDKLYLG